MSRVVSVQSEDGETIKLVVPTNLPSNARAEQLRAIYNEHVRHLDDWKGRAVACVPAEIADDVCEAMNFMGSLVDVKRVCVDNVPFRLGYKGNGTPVDIEKKVGLILIWSRGYRAHGF